MFKRIPGTKDILPEEMHGWQKIEEISRKIFSLYNYSEIRPPLIEEAVLFNRSLGESTEIVQKQMFLIKHQDDVYALRPEATASVVRAYIENNFNRTKGLVKLYYIGPMFRLERPQKGRQRQFHHLGSEVIGSGDAYVDVEIIALADHLLKSLSIEDYKIKINSLGCEKDKKKLKENLRQILKDKIDKLCLDCKFRFKNNILRILDCKKENCIKIVEGLEIEELYLCDSCKRHFTQVKEGLRALGLDYEVSPYLVRGLDYYTHTVFEITHQKLGSQNALGAGGRYDNLVSQLGGPDKGAMGFAFGIERLLLVSRPPRSATRNNLVYIITLGEEAKRQGLKLLDSLRKSEISCDTDYAGKSLKAAMRKAHDLGASYVLFIGDEELKKNVVALKDMVSGEQKEVLKVELLEVLKEKIKTGI